MARYSITEAKNNLSKLIDLAIAGEEVTITRRGVDVVTLAPKQQELTRFGPEWFIAHRVVPANHSPEFDSDVLIRRMRDKGY